MKTLNTAEKLYALKLWKSEYRKSCVVWNKVKASLGDCIESDLYRAHWSLFDSYTLCLEQILDAGSWLEWYAFENDMGKKAMRAGDKNQLRHIKSLSDLLWVIELVPEK